MFVDEAAEYRLLATAIDEPRFILGWSDGLFTGSRVPLFQAMRDTFIKNGVITSEGIELRGIPVPNDLEAARGAAAGPLLEKLADLATRRQLADIADSINDTLRDRAALDRTKVSQLLELPPVVSNEDSDVQGGINLFTSQLGQKLRGEYKRVDTGLPFLNYMLGGEWPRKAMTIVMGSPGGGKTAMVCNSMVQMARAGLPSLFFSIEMPKERIVPRMVANIAEIDGLRLRSGELNADELRRVNEALQEIQTLPIYVIDKPDVGIWDIMNNVRLHKERYGIEAFFIDYLQIISYDGDVDWEAYGKITKACRTAAVMTDTACIMLSQQNRDPNKRGLDRLLGSSRIAQIADTVIDIDLEDVKPGSPFRTCALNFLKNRDGPVGISNCFYEPQYMRFV